MDNLEYHLLGNHLLENGFSLLFGAYYFHNNNFYYKSKKILLEQLEEQILNDGGHFELSPMYHQIMLFRVLDAINLIKNNSWQNHELLNFLIKKAELMLSWIDAVSYENGDIPMFNDSAHNIAPSTKDLFDYAERLGVRIGKISLNESGYRKCRLYHYEQSVLCRRNFERFGFGFGNDQAGNQPGFTGSNGKTTTVSMTAHILQHAGKKTGALSTAFMQIEDQIEWNETQKTSPSPFLLQQFLKKLVLNLQPQNKQYGI
jgi:hypothetical protein